jgi:hypothetical protein
MGVLVQVENGDKPILEALCLSILNVFTVFPMKFSICSLQHSKYHPGYLSHIVLAMVQLPHIYLVKEAPKGNMTKHASILGEGTLNPNNTCDQGCYTQ